MLVEYRQEFWDGRYRQRNCIWSGKQNRHLVAETEDLRLGKMLDVKESAGMKICRDCVEV